MIDFEIENELRSVLTFDEKLIWAGKPRRGVFLRTSDAFMIPFSLLWGGFAIFWEYSAIRMGAPFFFYIFGIPFVAIGLYMIFGRFFVEAKRREKTIYAITQDRIIIKSGIFKTEITSFNIKSLSNISFTQKADGSGTILLGGSNPFAYMQSQMSMRGTKMIPQLDLIEDVKTVYDKLISLQQQKQF